MLTDTYGRRYRYVRLSVTDICNYRCNYCLPDGYQKTDGKHFLTLTEIQKLVSQLAAQGIEKIRITGGEPAIRQDLPDIIRLIKNTPGIKKVALTTNGYRLNEHIQDWLDAGLDAINISIDSLRPEMFARITGFDHLQQILQGLDTLLAIKTPDVSVKVNAVLMQQFNEHELADFINWIANKDLTLRFIELMETGDNKDFFSQQHVSGEQIKQRLQASGWLPVIQNKTSGPAQEFYHAHSQGRIGLIMPYSKDFCSSCNRLRITAQGKLHLCLFGEQGFDLLPYLGETVNGQSFADYLQQCLSAKWQGHRLHEHNPGLIQKLAQIGG